MISYTADPTPNRESRDFNEIGYRLIRSRSHPTPGLHESGGEGVLADIFRGSVLFLGFGCWQEVHVGNILSGSWDCLEGIEAALIGINQP